jgi:signal transduction histidine kinase
MPSGPPGAGERSTRRALRLVPDDAARAHPLTTYDAPLLPHRGAAGASADIWEELDHAAAWVHHDIGGGHEAVRHTLRLLCVAARAAWATIDLPDAPSPIGRGDVPSGGPIAATILVQALRRRLTEQTIAARAGGLPAADPAEVLRATLALDRVQAALEGDGVGQVVDQLAGATAFELLVEVAHDMRSPLGSILFLIERLRSTATDAPRPPAEDRQLALVYGAAFGLSAMVSDVMELARGGDRLAAGEPGPFVVAEVLEAVSAIVAPLAEEKGLALRVEAPPSEARVGHGAALQRVLVNLVTNALKFTPSGEVSVRAAARGRSRVAFVVRDTGRGIPPHVVAQLFQTFRRRATGEAYAFSSAGLGLAICQRLLAAMGSELRVESTEGAGTTFRFELDLPPAPAR